MLRGMSSLDKNGFINKYLAKTITIAAAIFILMVVYTQNSYAGPPPPTFVPTVDGLYDDVATAHLGDFLLGLATGPLPDGQHGDHR